jgi:homoserine O-acetyltransferase
MNDQTLHFHTGPDLVLASGAVLAAPVTAYRCMGKLDADGANAVLVLHGYTTGPTMLDPDANVAEGSWSELVGPGKPIDTDRYFVVCPNMLGSCYGSTGPASIDPPPAALRHRLPGADGGRHRRRAEGAAGRARRETPGRRDRAVVRRLPVLPVGGEPSGDDRPGGPGGRRALASGRARHGAGDPGRAVGRAGLASLDGGHRDAMFDTLLAMRTDTLTKYGVDVELAERFPDPAARAAKSNAWRANGPHPSIRCRWWS